MSTILNSIQNMNNLDEFARKDSLIHRINPTIKLLTTVIFLFIVISFDKYNISGLFIFFLYPVLVFSLADIPLVPIIKRILIIEPFIIGIGILNPLLESHSTTIFNITFSIGWITFLSILIKSLLTITATLLLISTTGFDKIASALRSLKVPKIFVLQLLLTYRYISVLLEELIRMIRAYTLRSPFKKGIHISNWGSFAGQLILRTFDRAQRLYFAMCARGFTGDYEFSSSDKKYSKVKVKDYIYILVWGAFFIFSRIYNISESITIFINSF
ncbi:MAG: cobalt ECF transporter T component CbiQ [Clostridiales bacterium]